MATSDGSCRGGVDQSSVMALCPHRSEKFGYGTDCALSEKVKVSVAVIHESGIHPCPGAVNVAELILQDLQRFGHVGLREGWRRMYCMGGADGAIRPGFDQPDDVIRVLRLVTPT